MNLRQKYKRAKQRLEFLEKQQTLVPVQILRADIIELASRYSFTSPYDMLVFSTKEHREEIVIDELLEAVKDYIKVESETDIRTGGEIITARVNIATIKKRGENMEIDRG